MDADKLSALIAESSAPEPAEITETEPEVAADVAETEAEPTEAVESDDEPEAEAEPTGNADALLEAIDSGDVRQLIAALGDKAEALLGSKAHGALRVAARELDAKEKRLATTAERLDSKYADPIAVRKACEAGAENAFDLFADYVEKTTGRTWNDVLKWAAKAAIGRGERLTAQAAEGKAKEEKRATAQAEVMTWVQSGIKGKPIAAVPNAAQLVYDKIKEKHAHGIDTPAKAIPLVLADLRKHHATLAKVVGKEPAKVRREAPSARDRVSTKETPYKRSSIEEDIAWAKQFRGKS
jgi:hypothetical protein